MNHEINDSLLMAYIDGELSEADQQRVEEAMRNSPELVNQLEAFRTMDEQIIKSLEPALHVNFEEISSPINKQLPNSSKKADSGSWFNGILRNQYSGFAVATFAAYSLATVMFGVWLGQSNQSKYEVNGTDLALLRDLGNVESIINIALEKKLSGISHSSYFETAGNLSVTPIKTWRNAERQYCREFQIKLIPSGQETEIVHKGWACRKADGKWHPQSLSL